SIRIPPLGAGEFASRIVVWSIGFACLGTGAVLRALGLKASGFTIIFIGHTLMLPLPMAAGLALLCGWMLLRIVLTAGKPTVIAIDGEAIIVENPTQIIRRKRIPLERVAAIETGIRGRDGSQTWPHFVLIMLRDGPASMLRVEERDREVVRTAIESAIESP